MPSRTIDRSDSIALILAAACWGVGTVVSKRALDDIAPVVLLPLQLAVSLVVLSVLLRRQDVPLRADGPPLLARLGILNPGIAYALTLLGLTTISASLSVLIGALEPIMILVLAGVFLHERITAALAALSFVALGGLVLVVNDPSTGGQAIGVALALAGVACCAVYTVATRRWLPEARETGQVVLAQQAHGLGFAGLVLIGVVVLAGTISPMSLTPTGLLAAAVSGALYYAGAYWFYLAALRNVPASVASVSFYLIPIVGIAASAAFLGERLAPIQWIGVGLVLVAVAAIYSLRIRETGAPEASMSTAVPTDR